MEPKSGDEDSDQRIRWSKVLLYFALWTLVAGLLVVFSLSPEPPTSGNCVGPYGVAPCLNDAGSDTGDAIVFGYLWFVSAVVLVVFIVRDRRHQPRRRRVVRRRRRKFELRLEEDDRMIRR